MLAVRVPPSAWMTSQSTVTVRGPRAAKSTTARRERPMRRWISRVRPPTRPFKDSRSLRGWVAWGSMAYSPVTQPPPEASRNGGTCSVTVAAQMTRVRPQVMRQEPSAKSR